MMHFCGTIFLRIIAYTHFHRFKCIQFPQHYPEMVRANNDTLFCYFPHQPRFSSLTFFQRVWTQTCHAFCLKCPWWIFMSQSVQRPVPSLHSIQIRLTLFFWHLPQSAWIFLLAMSGWSLWAGHKEDVNASHSVSVEVLSLCECTQFYPSWLQCLNAMVHTSSRIKAYFCNWSIYHL